MWSCRPLAAQDMSEATGDDMEEKLPSVYIVWSPFFLWGGRGRQGDRCSHEPLAEMIPETQASESIVPSATGRADGLSLRCTMIEFGNTSKRLCKQAMATENADGTRGQ